MKTLALLTSIALAGTAGAQTIDTSGMHSMPLPPPTTTTPQTPSMQHALVQTITRAVAQRSPDGKLEATCQVESNPAAIAVNREQRSHRAHKE